MQKIHRIFFRKKEPGCPPIGSRSLSAAARSLASLSRRLRFSSPVLARPMKTLALGDAVARFLLTYILPKRYGDRIRRNVEPAPTTILATGETNRDRPRMTLIEGVFATLLFDFAVFGTDNIVINGIIRIFTKIQNGWNQPFRSEMEAAEQIQQFCDALSIQTKPWIWEKPMEQYGCLNDFFSRRYAPKFMPALGKVDVVSPACCTMQMYESDEDMQTCPYQRL